MSPADCALGQSLLAIFQIIRADPGHDPFPAPGSFCRDSFPAQLLPSQCDFRGLPILLAPDSLALLIKQRDAFLGARRRGLSAVCLFPMPGGAA